MVTLEWDEGCAPSYATELALGADLRSSETLYISPGHIVKVKTGVRIKSADACDDLQVRGRSGLGSKGILFVLGVGTVDPDYRDEILVPLMNLTTEDFVINRGDRIAQLVSGRASRIQQLDVGGKRHGGFGSSGYK